MSLVDIWQGIADALTAAYSDVHVTAYEPELPTVPAMFPILPETGTFHVVFPHTSAPGGAADVPVTVRVLVGSVDQGVTSEALLPYLDPSSTDSIRAALEADPTLGGAVDDLVVTGWTNGGARFGYGVQQEFVGVDVLVTVYV